MLRRSSQAEQHQRLLVDELNHRVKNMLTVVISLATQTLRRSGTLEEFSGVFLGRVHALTAAYALLSRESWSSRAAGRDRSPRSCGHSWPAIGPTSSITGPAVPLASARRAGAGHGHP